MGTLHENGCAADSDWEKTNYSAYSARRDAAMVPSVKKLLAENIQRIRNATKKGLVDIKVSYKSVNFADMDAVVAQLKDQGHNAWLTPDDHEREEGQKSGKCELCISWENPRRGGW